jgi:hypothetical protein
LCLFDCAGWLPPWLRCRVQAQHSLVSFFTPFRAGLQGGRLFMLPAVREGHELAAMFVFPSLQHEYRAKAEDYISHFVGHEGAGSLLSTLKARRHAGHWRSPPVLSQCAARSPTSLLT